MKKLIYFLAVLGLWLGLNSCGGSGGSGNALDSYLDKTFANNGVYSSKIFGLEGNIKNLKIDKNGKIVIVGSAKNSSGDDDLKVARLNSDGSLDSSFGVNGVFTYDSGNDDSANSLAFDSNGKIVVVGVTDNGNNEDALVLRLNSNGTLDNSFFVSGVYKYDGVKDDEAFDVAIDSSDNIYIAASFDVSPNGPTGVKVFKISGNTFNDNFYGFGTSKNSAAYGIVLHNSNIYFAGYGDEDYLYAYKIFSNGNADNNFGNSPSGGKFYLNNAEGYSITIDNNGKILVAGYDTNSNDIVIVRLNSDGNLDSSFANNGKYVYDFNGNDDFASYIKCDSSGKIYFLALSVDSNGNSTARVVRLNSNGKLDTSFANNGYYVFNKNKINKANGLAIDNNGKIVVGLSSGDNTYEKIEVYRINP